MTENCIRVFVVEISRRKFLVTSSVAALSLGAKLELAYAAPPVSSVWMETPDVLAFAVNDGAIIPGNIVQLSTPDNAPYDSWVLRKNPRSGNMEYCAVIGLDKKHLRFEDQVSPAFVDRRSLRNAANYSITGAETKLNVAAVYYRDEANGQGELGHQKVLLLAMRHTVYLQLTSRPTQGVNYTIKNAAGAFADFNFTFDDKTTRAGGIKASSAGHRPKDSFKYAYLCSRLPQGPNHGVVDFAESYGLKKFYIIDRAGNTQFEGPITLRRRWDQRETGDGYTEGIDVADLSQSWTVTAVTKGNPTVVTCPGHPFVNGDKVRFRGMSGMIQLEGAGATGQRLWVAATATVIDSNSFSVNIDSRSFSNLTTSDYSPSLGGVLNQVYKCFNTNRAATSVWGLDYSTFQPSSADEYKIYIPGYGVSDPIPIGEASWANVAAKHHEGLYNLRLGCEIKKSSSYSRGIALKDGVNGCANYWSTLPAIFASEFSTGSFGPKARSGDAAYATGSKVGPGFITNKRALNSSPGHQDAGDNDDIGADHLNAMMILAWVFHELPHASRYLPLKVQRSTELLDPVLFAGTDDLPPLFHELAWHLEAYRTHQNENGSAPGGWGVGHINAQIPNYPEPIQYYRGTDAGGIYAGQTVMAFVYASDHYTNMLLAGAFGKFAQIAYDYKLMPLGDAYQQAAISAYRWADNLLNDAKACDAYYLGELDIKTKMGWDEKTYRSCIAAANIWVVTAKRNTCGILYRLSGATRGQTPYGDFIDANSEFMPGTVGGWDYLKTPGAKPGVKNYCLWHASDGLNTKFPLSIETCFNTMAGGVGGGTTLSSPHRMILAHMATVVQRGVSFGVNSEHLKTLQAGLGFMLGANQPGKAFMTGFGPRPYSCILHEDSYKMGVAAPPGITPFGYFLWAEGLIVFNYASGRDCDGPLQWISSNVTGNWEKRPNAGSNKMENPWRFGSGYWDWAPENKGLIFQSEFSLAAQVNSLIASLYLHAWDGNSISK